MEKIAALEIINRHVPHINLAVAFVMADELVDAAFVRPAEWTHDTLTAYAARNATIADFIANQQRINAIKELRGFARCSLKEAKDAVDAAYPNYYTPR